jgi:hypothetical protein
VQAKTKETSMRKIVLLLAAIVMGGLTAWADDPVFSVDLLFSLDDGKTFDADFPILEKPQEVLVKANWTIEGETREVKAGIVTSTLSCAKSDFASACRGYQRNWGAGNGYYQRLKKYWFAFKNDRTCTYRLDLRARPAGEMGVKNKWDKTTHKFVDAPLPACPALPPGTHKFTVQVLYRLKADNKAISKDSEFFVTMKTPETAAE